MCNLVYGQIYPQLWIENHLKTLCDSTNLPAVTKRYKLEYVIFTDQPTLDAIQRHPNFMMLGKYAEIIIVKINWPPDSDPFASRYNLLVQMFHEVLKTALEKQAIMSCWVADLVFAKLAIPNLLGRIESGYDAVFNVPIRSAADSLNQILAKLPGAPSALELFEMAYAHLHHLWVASHVTAPMFSKFPYSMLWNSGTGLLAHNFGITPIIFETIEELKTVRGVIDADVPAKFKNPYWATDWLDAPVAGVEPLSNGHYPPFLQHKYSEDFISGWAAVGTHPTQINNLHKPLFYPSRKHFNNEALAKQALSTVASLQNRLTSELQLKLEGV